MSDYLGDCRVRGHLIVDFDVHFNHSSEDYHRRLQMSYTASDRSCSRLGRKGSKRQVDLLSARVVVSYESWSETLVEAVHRIPAGDTGGNCRRRNTGIHDVDQTKRRPTKCDC